MKFLMSILLPIAAGIFLVMGRTGEENENLSADFSGTVIGREDNRPTQTYRRGVARRVVRSRSTALDAYILIIQTEKDEIVHYPVTEMANGYYHLGDYLIKLPGEKKPAVFREGRQIKNSHFLQRDVAR